MLQQHSRNRLESCDRPQLWTICREKGLKCFPKSADCIDAILGAQPEKIADAQVESISTVEQAQQPESIAIDYYNYEVRLDDRLIAEITHDDRDFATQRWVVKINGEEAFRDTTVARCTSWVSWHQNQGTLPLHDEWKTAQEEVIAHIEEQAEEVAPELAETTVKVARQLQPGDKVVLDGEIWRIERINRQQVQYQVWHSEVHGIRFHLTLLPDSYQYRPYQIGDGEPTDWEAARQHEFAEADRFVNTAKYLYPYGEARFEVVVREKTIAYPAPTNDRIEQLATSAHSQLIAASSSVDKNEQSWIKRQAHCHLMVLLIREPAFLDDKTDKC